MFGLIVLGVFVVAALGLVVLAQQSKSGGAPGIIDGALAPCPTSPNCVSSEAGTPESHLVAAWPLGAWDKLPASIDAAGGKVVDAQDEYIAAEFSSKLMVFVDDVEFRKGNDGVHVRSASRVGHSDMGVNRKRIEALRLALAE